MTILSQPKDVWCGRTIASITVRRAGRREIDLVMVDAVTFTFTDGTSLCLGLDWRGDEAYISEYVPAVQDAAPGSLQGDDLAIWHVLEGAEDG